MFTTFSGPRRSRWRYQPLVRGAGYATAGLIVLSYLLVGLYPFRLKVPHRVPNGAVLRDRQAVDFPAEGFAQTKRPPAWLGEAISQDAVEVQLRVRSARPDQRGPARIFTVSESSLLRNLTIGQQHSDLIVRLRTPASSLNGIPEHKIAGVFNDSGWRELRVSVHLDWLIVHVDGETALRHRLPEQPLENWDRNHRLALGNELTFDRPWLGEISRATVRVSRRQWDYLDKRLIDVPPTRWADLDFQYCTPWSEVAVDVGLNFWCFVPLGAALAAASGRWLAAAIACATTSLLVEAAQLFIVTRMPSLSDWLSNSLGGLTGALCAAAFAVAAARVSGRRNGNPKRAANPLPHCKSTPP